MSQDETPTPDELRAALEIAGRRLIEAERVRAATAQTAERARRHWQCCNDDVEQLLKVIHDLSGGHGQQTVWLPTKEGVPINIGRGIEGRKTRFMVHVGGHKGSQKKAAAICRRLGAASPPRSQNRAGAAPRHTRREIPMMDEQQALEIEHLMRSMATTDPARFAELCALLEVDPDDFKTFLAADTEQ